MKKFNQLGLEQRYKIEALLKAGHNQTQIASILGIHKSSICRELKRAVPKRGVGAGSYSASNAERKCRKRHKEKNKQIRLTEKLKKEASELLTRYKWSPELISARWKKEGKSFVSHETLYKWIWETKKSNHRQHAKYKKLYKELKHGKRRRKRGNYKDSRGTIKNRIPIDQRPPVVEERKRIGDIEVDLMMGKNHKSALLVMTDRTSLTTAMEKLSGKCKTEVKDKICQRLERFDSCWVKTLTFDNGKEFAKHMQIAEQFNVKTYFTRPYTSQDKGTVENRIGVIRRFFPKKTDLRNISKEEIKEVEIMINKRPIRKFDYLSPIEVLKNRFVAFIS